MGRTTDSVCKLCRREGIKLYLKGSRCDSPKCAIERRNTAPGMHGYRRGKPSEYGIRLREKQKLKRFYGVLERQFRRYFEPGLALAGKHRRGAADASGTPAGQRRSPPGLRAVSRAAARQLVIHGHVMVNGKACNIPSLLLKAGDTVAVKNRPRSLQLVKLALQESPPPVPDFLDRSAGEPPEGRLTRLPTRQRRRSRGSRTSGAADHRVLLTLIHP